MTRPFSFSSIVVMLATFVTSFGALAQREILEPTGRLESPGRVRSATVYEAGAVVAREGVFSLSAGDHSVRITDLPSTVIRSSIRAHASDGVSIRNVIAGTAERTPPRDETAIVRVNQELVSVRDQLASLEEQQLILDKQEALLESIAERTANTAASTAGTGQLDLDEITRLSAYLAEQHADILARRRSTVQEVERVTKQRDQLEADLALYEGQGEPEIYRVATIAVNVNDRAARSPVTVSLTYLVTDVSWAPSYNIKTNSDGSSATIEFDAVIHQGSGEDWNNIALTVTNAPVELYTAPAELDPWFIDVSDGDVNRLLVPKANDPAADASALTRAILSTAGESRLQISPGIEVPLVSYDLPQDVTIANDAENAQRVRIMSIRSRPALTHVAAPLLSEHAYVRAEVQNAGQVHILPGPASVFWGGTFSGETTVPYIEPGGRLSVFVGIDPDIRVRRINTNRRTKKTGLLADGRETRLEYRIRITNTTGRTIDLELWDRAPVSRDDRIKVLLASLSHRISDEGPYRRDQRPLGFLKWSLPVEPQSELGNETRVEYTVVISHHKDVEATFLPK